MAVQWNKFIGLLLLIFITNIYARSLDQNKHELEMDVGRPKTLICGRVSKLSLSTGLEPVHLGGVLIRVLEKPAWAGVLTGSDGYFMFKAPIRQHITIIASKNNYTTTQTATIFVPHLGYCDKKHVIIQMPNRYTTKLITSLRQEKVQLGRCFVMSRVAGSGSVGARVTITTSGGLVAGNSFYMGAAPFMINKKHQRRLDAGEKAVTNGMVLFPNLVANNVGDFYVITAYNEGTKFSPAVRITCPTVKNNEFRFINVNAPFSPHTIHESN